MSEKDSAEDVQSEGEEEEGEYEEVEEIVEEEVSEEEGDEEEEEEEEGEVAVVDVELAEKPVRRKKGASGAATGTGGFGPEGETRSDVIRQKGIEMDAPLAAFVYAGKKTLTDTIEHSCTEVHPNQVLYVSRKVKKVHAVKNVAENRSFDTIEHFDSTELLYSDWWKMVKSVASCLPDFVEGAGEPECFIGLFLDTCKEWTTAFHAAQLAGITPVTIYSTLGLDAVAAVVKETGLQMLVCDARNVQAIDRVLGKLRESDCKSLKRLLVVGDLTYRSFFFETHCYYDALCRGFRKMKASFPNRPKKDDLALIMYTSGTTSAPKGVMMKQRQFVSAMKGLTDGAGPTPADTYLSYLPLAHVFELVCHNAMIAAGASIGIGNPRTLSVRPGASKVLGDLEVVRPTIMIGVPKVWESIRKGILARPMSCLKKAIFKLLLKSKMNKIRKKQLRHVHVFLDNKFKAIYDKLGGRLRLLASGGAPLSEETQAFLQTVLGSIYVGQGYALTETCCGGFMQPVDERRYTAENVGYPFTCVECCLESIPSMKRDAMADPPQGEILLRGPCISSGYYKKPIKTKEAFGEDGWFHTGDIGTWLEDGSLKIIGRKKSNVKLKDGEYVSLGALEMVHGISNFVAPNSLVAYAESSQDYVIGVGLPNPAFCQAWGEDNIGTKDLDVIVKNAKFLAAVRDSFVEVMTAAKRPRREIIRKIAMFNHEWTPENGLLTSTNKLKRPALEEYYHDALQSLYAGGDVPRIKRRITRVEVEEEEEGEVALPDCMKQYKPTFVIPEDAF